MSADRAALLLAWGAIVLLTLGFAGLLNHVHALTVRQREPTVDDGPAPGPVVGFRGPGSSRLVGIASASAEGVVAVFVSPTCVTCHRVVRRLAEPGTWPSGSGSGSGSATGAGGGPDLVVVSTGGCLPFDHPGSLVTCLDEARAEHAALAVPASPWVMALAPDGTIVESTLITDVAVVTRARDRLVGRSGAVEQAPAP